MDDASLAQMTQQHVLLLQQMQLIWSVLIVVAVFVLLTMAVIFALAAWGVSRVNKRQAELEGKFTLLIDVLLQYVSNRAPGTTP